MDADDIIDQLEQLLGNIGPSQLSRINDIVGKPTGQPAAPASPADKFAAKRATGAAAAQAALKPAPAATPSAPATPVELKPGTPEYFAAKRAAGAAAAQANITTKTEPTPQTFGSRGIPGLGESAFQSNFLGIKL